MSTPETWRRFARTVETVAASALAEAASGQDEAEPAAREEFIALAAAPVAAARHEAVTLKNSRRDITLTLAPAEGGTLLRVRASGHGALRLWQGARAELVFAATGLLVPLRFDGDALAETLVPEPLAELARGRVSLARQRALG